MTSESVRATEPARMVTHHRPARAIGTRAARPKELICSVSWQVDCLTRSGRQRYSRPTSRSAIGPSPRPEVLVSQGGRCCDAICTPSRARHSRFGASHQLGCHVDLGGASSRRRRLAPVDACLCSLLPRRGRRGGGRSGWVLPLRRRCLRMPGRSCPVLQGKPHVLVPVWPASHPGGRAGAQRPRPRRPRPDNSPTIARA